jgi:hypothetical protein
VAGLGLLGAGLALPLPRAKAATLIRAVKQRGCGCCEGWAQHVRAEGFACEVETMDDLEPVKARLGVPDALRSCHTATVEGYVLEGHVPASAIRKLLAERPAIRGLAVPGMPLGSPGMPGEPPDAYEVVAFAEGGAQHVFMRFLGEREA